MKLPATLQEAEALAYAREHVRAIRDEKIAFIGELTLSWFAKPDNRRATVQRMKDAATQPLLLMDLCNLATAGWAVAQDAVQELIVDYSCRCEAMPAPLATYNMALADPRHRPGRLGAPEKADTYLRDIAITYVAGVTCWKFGLDPTRQVASRPKKQEAVSGCRVTALAMYEENVGVSEPTVVRVWTKLGWIAFPDLKTRPCPF